ncbi:MAG TPA: hypothetical protein VM222_05675 [Planctomycetota bacterium]|nr:hypothetical protein [Planctomycetota bacterium]
MLQVVTLLLALAAQDPLTIKGSLKEVPAEGKAGPVLLCEGTANLPNGAVLSAYLYYERVIEGSELHRDFAIVKAGAFTQEYPVYAKKNFPGKYIARFTYDPDLQNRGATGFPLTTADVLLQIGGPEDVDRESKAIREQLAGEVRAMVALGQEIKLKLDELKDKPASAWDPLIASWRDEANRIQSRADPHKTREYSILRLNAICDGGFEDLRGILLSSARCAAGGQRGNCLEGITRLNQSAEKWISDLTSPRLTDVGRMVVLIEDARALLRKVAENPDQPVLPSRRKFLEMTDLLDRSVPGIFHEVVLGISDRASTFFGAAADKSPDLQKAHQDLDALLLRFAHTLRDSK